MDISQLQLSPALSTTGGDSTDSKHAKIVKAATQFEALLIGEMLKSVREGSDDGWLGGGSDSSAESAFGIAENQFAQTISEHGGFGLAKTIERSLEKAQSTKRPSVSGQ
jgi:Rod binding domain-containing protein